MFKYLITGGAGFIGSHLADRLIELGHDVIVLDDLSTGKEENLNKNCIFVKGSILDSDLLSSLFDKVDFCYHLAATASVQKSIDAWVESHENNLVGTIKVFNEASKRNIPVIYASSAAVYGSSTQFPLNEKLVVKQDSPYGLDKYNCELQAMLFGKLLGLKTFGARFFNVYGARQDSNSLYSGVISIFVDRINRDLDINVFGEGNQERDFIFIDDIVDALIQAQEHVSTSAIISNFCTGCGTSINKLIHTLFTLSNKNVNINYLEPRKGDIYKSIGDREFMDNILKPKKFTSIESGLSSFIYLMRL